MSQDFTKNVQRDHEIKKATDESAAFFIVVALKQ
jgi:hypothetical protein